ncbi:MAG: hypothetical protein ABJO67_00215 [Pseudoruegeria sp.]
MSPYKIALSAAALTVMSFSAALAEGYEKFGEVESWKVFADLEKKSCLIERSDVAGSVVQMGLTEDRGVGYVGVFTSAETNIKKGDETAVAILIGEHVYTGEATGMKGNITEGYSGGYVLSDDPQFLEDIEQQHEMIVFPDTDYFFIVDLTGTKKAIEMARECNASLL